MELDHHCRTTSKILFGRIRHRKLTAQTHTELHAQGCHCRIQGRVGPEQDVQVRMQQHHRPAPRSDLFPEQGPRRYRVEERGAARVHEHRWRSHSHGRQAARWPKRHAQCDGCLLGREAGWHVDVQVRWRRGQGHGCGDHDDVDRGAEDGACLEKLFLYLVYVLESKRAGGIALMSEHVSAVMYLCQKEGVKSRHRPANNRTSDVPFCVVPDIDIVTAELCMNIGTRQFSI